MAEGNTNQVEGRDSGRRILLKDKAYEEIKGRILDGRFAPGSFLAERWLADTLDMSKTPVRAAIGRLETEGFVAVSPQQGIVVRELSFEEIIDHFDIRVALESFVVRRLAGRLTAEQESELRALIAEQRKAALEQNVPAYVTRDGAFHMSLCRFAGNREIIRVMGRQHDKLHHIVRRLLGQNPDRMSSSTDEHEAVLDAVADGDGDGAAERIARHMEYGKRYLISH